MCHLGGGGHGGKVVHRTMFPEGFRIVDASALAVGDKVGQNLFGFAFNGALDGIPVCVQVCSSALLQAEVVC
jgi:hypothetical protein